MSVGEPKNCDRCLRELLGGQRQWPTNVQFTSMGEWVEEIILEKEKYRKLNIKKMDEINQLKIEIEELKEILNAQRDHHNTG